jgi:hypothetical protein
LRFILQGFWAFCPKNLQFQMNVLAMDGQTNTDRCLGDAVKGSYREPFTAWSLREKSTEGFSRPTHYSDCQNRIIPAVLVFFTACESTINNEGYSFFWL